MVGTRVYSKPSFDVHTFDVKPEIRKFINRTPVRRVSDTSTKFQWICDSHIPGISRNRKSELQYGNYSGYLTWRYNQDLSGTRKGALTYSNALVSNNGAGCSADQINTLNCQTSDLHSGLTWKPWKHPKLDPKIRIIVGVAVLIMFC